MNINRQEVIEIACKYCEFRGEGDYTPKHFPTGDAVMAFVKECIELNELVALASQVPAPTPQAEARTPKVAELTDEQIDAIHDGMFPASAFPMSNVRKFARAVLAAAGIHPEGT